MESQSFDGDVAEEVDPGTVTLDAGQDGESEDEMSEVADASSDGDAELDEVSSQR